MRHAVWRMAFLITLLLDVQTAGCRDPKAPGCIVG